MKILIRILMILLGSGVFMYAAYNSLVVKIFPSQPSPCKNLSHHSS